MPFESFVAPVAIPANGQYGWFIVQGTKRVRPINIGGEIPAGTFNLDSFIAVPNDGHAFYLDSTQNRGTPYDFSLNHQGWLEPQTHLHFQVSAFALAGNVVVRMWYEEVSREEKAPQSVSVKESVEIDTKPFGRLFRK